MTATSPKLFAALRTDPKKVAEGVWITHPETGDQFLVRRLWCAEHMRAFFEAADAYQAEHGEKSHETDEGARHVESVGLASGVIVDWKLKDSDRPYDAAAMAGALADPELDDLRHWFRVSTANRKPFRPDHVAGN